MRHISIIGTLGVSTLLAGCVGAIEGTTRPTSDTPVIAIGSDAGSDDGDLRLLEAGIYVDPDGCHIWMIDDGVEGYWTRRYDPVSGLPVCTDIAPPNSVVGEISNNPGVVDRVPASAN